MGVDGSGTFNQNGGTNTVSGVLSLAGTLGSSGAYNLIGGSLSVDTFQLNAGAWSFTQTGGTFNYRNFNMAGGSITFTDLYLGKDYGSSSNYNLSGGSLHATNEYVGYYGSGAFAQSSGTNSVSGSLMLGFDQRGQRHL